MALPEAEAYYRKLIAEKYGLDPGMVDEQNLLGLISTGQYSPELLQAYMAMGGGLDKLMRAMTAGAMGFQQQQAMESQQRQNQMRQALMAPGAEGGPSAIANLLNRKSFFNPYAGPQQVPGNPLAGVQFPGMSGSQAGTGDKGPKPPEGGGLPAPPTPTPPPLPPEAPPEKMPETREPNTQNQYLAFLEALRRSGING